MPRPHDWTSTPFTRLLGIDLPVVLGAFGGASSTALVAAVSNSGGLGSFGLYGMGADAIRATAGELRSATSRPFALNLWLPLGGGALHGAAHPLPEEFASYVAALEPFFAELSLAAPEAPERYLPSFEEQFAAVLEARPAALSLVYGVPSAEVIDACRAEGIVVIGTATTPDEARALNEAGVDAIVASGMEAAGHRVSFLKPPAESLIGTMALVPRVVDAVDVPVVAAGGIADGRGVAAALTLGAQAAQLGTAFLACDESAANAAHRAKLWSADAETTVITSAFSSRASRGIPNRMSAALDAPGARRAPFPVQGWLTGRIKAEAARQGNADLMSLWAGQGAPLIRHHRASDVIDAIVRDVGELLG
ncbi:nitronate monooxygenase [Microbacterium sp. STN6]|uniref:NAD(P)H-dependent flavin oxidoreductase n=1 Tax=Microbacterium sp. STN6 TaxID=2995588 RepID=UPI0022609E88|nr:nitronate monooxygenase [Microbacterium sp. STN6]MCX7521198.1 nitronate monooxygenase [Microbacterium sp. STN6]